MRKYKKLGKVGERDFCNLCEKGDLTPNPVEVDENGWDILVEFPSNIDESLPPDLQPSPIEIKVQVKSTFTNTKSKNNRIEISNLLKLVKTKLPSFLCFMEYDDNQILQSIYIKHFDKELMEKVLKKSREIDNQGKKNTLNKTKLTVNYYDKDKVKVISGECLKKTFEKHIHQGIDKYIESKTKLLNTVGFEKGSVQGNFSLKSKDPLNDFIDFTIGLKKELNVHDVKMFHKRFDIISKTPFKQSDSGRMVIGTLKPSKSITIHFKETPCSPSMIFDSSVYTPPPGSVPIDQMKFRFKTEFFDLVLDFKSNKIEFFHTLDPEKKGRFFNLKNYLKLFYLLSESKNGIVIELYDDAQKKLFSTSLKEFDKISSNYFNIYHTIKMSSEILYKFQIPENDILISVEDLYKYQKSIIEFYTCICNYKKETIRLKFTLNRDFNDIHNPMGFMFPIITVIGDYKICCILGCIGILNKLENNEFLFTSQDVRLGGELISKINEDFDKEIILLEYDNLDDKLQEEKISIMKFDPMNFDYPLLPENLN